MAYENHDPHDPIKADSVNNMYLAFEPYPLESREAMDQFFIETMAVRTGDPAESPIKKIEKACKRPREHNVFLLLGHRGCGKSTELNRMKLKLEEQGRPVKIIPCALDLYLENKPEYSDLLILMADALLNIAKEKGAPVRKKTLNLIKSFWTEGEKEHEITEEADADAGFKAEIAAPDLIQSVLKLLVKVKGDVKYNEKLRTVYKEKLTGRFTDWQRVIRQLSDDITATVGKQPVLIFEDLDKLDQDEARNIFYQHEGKLSSFAFPVVYTFPIALYYDSYFRSMDSFFHVETYPMLKLRNIDGTPFPAGFDKLRDIVLKRVQPGLIDDDALTLMINKTGGSLRDLFRVLNDASDRAENRESDKVELEDAKRALINLQSDMTRMISGDQHEFLAEIYQGKHKKIEEKDKLLEMLQARTVLEYNGERWFDLHPLAADYLKELGYLP